MAGGGINLLWTRLLILSTIWQMVKLSSVNTTDSEDIQVAEDCTLNITDFKSVQKQFKRYSTKHKARLFDFRLSGIKWSDSWNETIEVFDPNLWSWVVNGSEFLAYMPIDYNILSFGLSRLAMMDLEVILTDYPTGCVDQLTFEQQRRLVTKEILRLTESVSGNNGLICRSTYSRRYWATGNVVGVGKTCCTGDELRDGRPARYDCDPQQADDHEVEGFAEKSTAVSIIWLLLPIIVIAFGISWWYDKQKSFDDFASEYRSNKLQKWAHFIIDSPERIQARDRPDKNKGIAAQPSSGDESTTSSGRGTPKVKFSVIDESQPEVQQPSKDEAKENSDIESDDETPPINMTKKPESEPTSGDDGITNLSCGDPRSSDRGTPKVNFSNIDESQREAQQPSKDDSTENADITRIKNPESDSKPRSGHDGKTNLLIEETDLEPFEGSVSILDLWYINMRGVAPGKIKITFFFVLHLVLVVYWIIAYSYENKTLRRLDSTEKILCTLGDNPYSWLWTDNSLFPHIFVAAVLVFLEAVLIVVVTFWWLLELECAKYLFWPIRFCLTPAKVEHELFQSSVYILVITSLVPVYSSFNSIIYTISGLIISIDKTLPWLTGGLIFVYDVQRSYQELIQTYTQIKGEMFKACKKYTLNEVDQSPSIPRDDQDRRNGLPRKSSKELNWETNAGCAIYDSSADVLKVDFVNNEMKSLHKAEGEAKGEDKRLPRNQYIPITKAGVRVDFEGIEMQSLHEAEEGGKPLPSYRYTTQTISFRIKEYKRPVLFWKYRDVHHDQEKGEGKEKGTNQGIICQYMLSKSTLRGLYEMIKPIKESMKKVAVKLALTSIFLALVVYTTAIHATAATGEARLVMTSSAPLLTVAVRWLAENMTTDAEKKLIADIGETDIQDLLPRNRPNYIIEVDRNKKEGEVDKNIPTRTEVMGVSRLKQADRFVSVLDRYDEFGRTQLMIAVNDVNNVLSLIKKGADPDLTDARYGRTALMYASMNGHKEVVVELINKGAKVNIQDEDGSTALMWASKKGHKEVVAELIKAGADVNIKDEDGSTALMWASMRDRNEVVVELIKAGADVNIKDERGETALILASMNGHKEVVVELINKGADVNIKDEYGGTALIWASKEGHKEVVAKLIKSGADVNFINMYDRTALMWVSKEGHKEVVTKLIKSGADVNFINMYGMTALDHAEKEGYVEVAEMLKNAIANTAGDADGREKDARGGV